MTNSDSKVKDIRVDLRFRNNLIMARMEEKMKESGLRSVKSICEAAGASYSDVNQVLNMKLSPVLKRTGRWRPCVIKLAEFLGVLPGDLFSERQFDELISNRASMEVSSDDVGRLVGSWGRMELPPGEDQLITGIEGGAAIDEALETLTPREELVIRMRFGLGPDRSPMTTPEIGQELRVGRARIDQILKGALAKLRHPSRRRMLDAAIADREQADRASSIQAEVTKLRERGESAAARRLADEARATGMAI